VAAARAGVRLRLALWSFEPQFPAKEELAFFLNETRKMIAVVDDDPSLLKGIVRLLSAHGFHAQAFRSAEAFLDEKNARKAACLILDINLGGISGIELRRQLTASGFNPPAIFITALDDEATLREATAAGCVACLRKPFSATSLIGAINGAI
jgi:FixJ family two-component response regulator